jgi:hypothetical protein
VRDSRNAAASGLPDVIPYLYRTIPANSRLQLLSAPLEESDPAIYDILQKVELPILQTQLIYPLITDVGEKTSAAFHQPHPIRELHIASCP